MNTFTATSSIRFAWELFKSRALFFVGSTICFLIVLWGLSLSVDNLLLTIIFYAVSIFIDRGIIAFFLKAHDTPASVRLIDLWSQKSFTNYLHYLFGSILVATLTLLGLILLIIPGILVVLACVFVKFLIVERDLGPIEAIKESARLTKGSRFEIALLLLSIIALNIVGAILLIIGLLVTVPVSALAMVHAYRMLVSKHDAMITAPVA
jgi:uncharacterized membrane protein